MKTLLTADLHLSSKLRDRYRVNTMHKLVQMATKKGVSQTVILGDLTEEKDRHSDWLTNEVVAVVRAFSKLGPVYILQGNHDSYSDPECPFFHFLRHMPNVRWFGRPTSFDTEGLGRVLWLPHTRDYKKEWAGIPFDGHAYIFAHCMFVGTKLGNGRVADGGIPIKIIPRSARCIAGDIHIPQTIGPIQYVGAPYTVDFGDDYKPRAIILDGDRQSDLSLDHLPQKRLIVYDGRPDEVDQLDVCNEGDIVKIRVHLPRSAVPIWPEQRDKMRAVHEKNGMSVHSIVPVIDESVGVDRVPVREVDAKTDEQVLRDFARHRGLDKGTRRRGEKLL